MSRLLFIKASPRGEASSSIAIAATYLDALRQDNPRLEVDVIDLWDEDLPEFDGNRSNAKLSVIKGETLGPAQATRWDEITRIARRFTSADRYLFAVPMWNGAIPYRLKLYIDIIHQPGLLFGFDPERGYYGLLEGKRATLVYTSGVYSPGVAPAFGADFHSTYMRWWLGQTGITAVEELRYQPTLRTADPQSGLAAAKKAAMAMARAE